MKGPAGVTALVLAETVAGALWLLFPTPLWSEVRRGFFKLTGSILLALAAAAWFSVSAALVAGSAAGDWSLRLVAALMILTAIWVGLMFVRRDPAARVVGFVSLAASVALLVAMAGTGRASYPVSLFQLVAGAAFLGSVLDGLLLGHWYLTDRGLSRAPIDRFTIALIAATGIELVAVLLGGFGPTDSTEQFNPLLTTAGLAPWIALGMVVTTGVIAFLIRAALRGTRSSAVQAATGFFYLAVITALTAEFAEKVRFLP